MRVVTAHHQKHTSALADVSDRHTITANCKSSTFLTILCHSCMAHSIDSSHQCLSRDTAAVMTVLDVATLTTALLTLTQTVTATALVTSVRCFT